MKKIAILGGGVGAMTTAFELTSIDGWKDQYEITVYQMGWRLGGKGASGRDRSDHDRILEHGLHLWMGFYENSFRAIKKAYDYCREHGLTPDSPFQSYKDAFAPMDFTVVMEDYEGKWLPWWKVWPKTDEWPGENKPPDGVHDWPSIIWQSVVDLVELVVIETESALSGDLPRDFRLSWLEKLVVRCILFPLRIAFRIIKGLEAHPSRHKKGKREGALKWLDRAMGLFEKLLHVAEFFFRPNRALRHLGILMDTSFAMVRGILDDGVLFRRFEDLDDQEFSDWMTKHGCKQPVNPITKGFYDACFAYRGGAPDEQSLNMAAGTMLGGMLRLLLTYSKSIMLWMEAGMGDTIFTPFYLVLRDRGVKFEFFHKVRHLGLGDDGKTVETVDLDIQATLKDPAKEYEPLITVNRLLCWPSEPDYDQLNEGEAIRNTKPNNDLESWWTNWKPVCHRPLRRGTDFDEIVYGLSLGTVKHVAAELVAANEQWRAMVDRVELVRTQAFQLWLKKCSRDMGWNPKPKQAQILDAWAEPFDTWADMTHLIKRENWRPADGVRSIAYFCNAMPADRAEAPFDVAYYPATQHAVGRSNAQQFLDKHIREVWPDSLDPDNPGRFDTELLVSEFYRVNIDPSELYVLSVAGSTRHRILAHDTGFTNLFAAGDWTLTHLNIGCVECAVQSGMMAAYGISGYPKVYYGPYGVAFPIDDRPL